MRKEILFTFMASISLIFLSSCGAGGEKSSTTFNVAVGAIISGTVAQNGGLVIIGKNNTTNESISLGYRPGEDMKISLNNGLWEFAAVSWTGEGSLTGDQKIFTGENRCGYSGFVELTGGSVNVNLTLSKASCAITFAGGDQFTDPTYMSNSDSTLFKKLLLRTCLQLPGTISGTSCDGAGLTPTGLTESYRIVMADPSANEFTRKRPLSSSCLNMADTSYLRVPYGSTLGSPFNVKILSYTEEDCAGTAVLYDLKEGLFKGQTILNTSVKTDTTIYPDQVLTLVVHNPESVTLTDPLFGFGNLGDYTITASATNPTTDYFALTGITDATTLTLDTTSGLNPYDELLWYVNSEDSSGCGGSFVPGMYGFTRIKSVVDSSTITLASGLDNYLDTDGSISNLTLPTTANLITTYGTTNYCSIQLVKVPHYKNLTIDSTGGALTLQPQTYNNGKGGIFVVKVNGTLTTTGANAITVSAASQGRNGSDLYSYPTCPTGKRCAYLGNASVGGYNGGGVTLLFTKNVQLNQVMALNSSGDGTYGEGGTLSVIGQSISGSTLYLNSTGTGSYTGGEINIKYCSSLTGYAGYSTNNFSPGGYGPFQNDTNFCL